MFDTVGSAVDREGDRRRLVVGVSTTAAAGLLLGLVSVWVAHQVVVRPSEAVTYDDMLVELDEEPDLAPPPLPSDGGGGGGGWEPSLRMPAEPPEPVVPDPAAALTPHDPLAPVVDASPAAGCGTATCDEPTDGPGGPGGGPGTGRGPGTGPGVGDGDGPGDGARTVRSEDLSWRRRVDPRFPAAAREQGVTDGRCVTTVTFDGSGRTSDVEIAGCASVFHDAVRDAMFGSRVYAPHGAAQRVRIVFQFDLVPASNP